MNKTFRILGVFALVAWTGLGLYGWSRVGKGVHVTLSETEQVASADAALLADRFDVLHEDNDAMVAAIAENFAALAGAMESGGATTATKLASTEARLAALEAALPAALEARETRAALEVTLGRAERLVADLERASAAAERRALASAAWDSGHEDGAAEVAPTVVDPASPDADEPVVQEPQVSGLEAEPVAATQESEMEALEAEVPAAPAEPAAPRSFLSFRIPKRDFSFEGVQTFEVLEDLSRVGFDAKSTLHDFTGVSNDVSGDFTVDLSRAADGIEGKIVVSSKSLDTGLEGRDEAMWEHLDTETFKTLEFIPTGFETLSLDKGASTITGRLTGKMTIRGKARDVTMDVAASVDDARRLVVEGEMPLNLEDFEVPVPNKLGLISVEKEVRVWIRLRMRARKPGSKS